MYTLTCINIILCIISFICIFALCTATVKEHQAESEANLRW